MSKMEIFSITSILVVISLCVISYLQYNKVYHNSTYVEWVYSTDGEDMNFIIQDMINKSLHIPLRFVYKDKAYYTNISAPVNEWIHLVVTYGEGNSDRHTYINGELVTE